MKISVTGFGYEEGKIKYDDERLNSLKEKMNPVKFVPFYAEILIDNYLEADVIVINKTNLIDLLILDIDKCETRIRNTDNKLEKALMEKCLSRLEEEKPLFEMGYPEDELKILRALTILSIKPVVVFSEEPSPKELLDMSFEKSNTMFFYTAASNEVHAWHIRKNSQIIDCAAKIHTDLARGFVKGDVVSFEDFIQCHNMNDAKTKGVAKLVNKEYIILPGDVIEIRSSL